jgi:protein gp37
MTKISWVRNADGTQGESWNPVTGCTQISEGCDHCWARAMNKRFGGGDFSVKLHPERLDIPLRRKKPTTYFVCSMSDLFHKDVPDDYVKQLLFTMDACYELGHLFLILTKRPERMKNIINSMQWWLKDIPKNIWLGVTCENQARADERIPLLLATPAAKMFVSIEPMLGKIDLRNISYGTYKLDALVREYGNEETKISCSFGMANLAKLDWVICGCESGAGRRPMNIDWVRSLRDQCVQANTAFFLKQIEIDGKVVHMPELDGKKYAQLPEVK